jgi:hypothetical protein
MPLLAADLPRFMNVTLVIYSKTDLEPLTSAIGKKMFVLYLGREHGAYKACLMANRSGKSPESEIRAFCKIIRGLPPSALKLWHGAKSRMFDVGIDFEPSGTYWFEISQETVADLAKLQAQIAVTVYGKLKKARVVRKIEYNSDLNQNARSG